MTHSFPTRRSSDLRTGVQRIALIDRCVVMPAVGVQRNSSLRYRVFAWRLGKLRSGKGLLSALSYGFDRHGFDDQAFVRHQKTRSEEHTSELQSIMRISYDVFCLKKKNKKNK